MQWDIGDIGKHALARQKAGRRLAPCWTAKEIAAQYGKSAHFINGIVSQYPDFPKPAQVRGPGRARNTYEITAVNAWFKKHPHLLEIPNV